MLTFKNTNIVFGALVIMLLILQIWFSVPLYVYIIAGLVYSLIIFYGSYYVCSNFFMSVICSGKTDEKKIAISFDDGPVQQYTPDVLQVLKENKVPAAFFCIGKRIAENEELLKQVYEEGHIIGNHSFTHTPMFDVMLPGQMLNDVKKMDAAMKNAIGLQPKLFRPPYGVTTPGMKKVMQLGGYTAVGWSIRSFDTMAKDQKKLLNKLLSQLKPGAIILLHDTMQITLAILPRFIQAARNEGYEFVRLDKLLNVKVYA